MNAPEVTAAIIASIVAVLGIIVNYLLFLLMKRQEREIQAAEIKAASDRLRLELETNEKQWQAGFRAELQRNLSQESTVNIVKERLRIYADVWKALLITSRHEWRESPDVKNAVRQLAAQLTCLAYGEVGLLMSDRSRRFLNDLRSCCSKYLCDQIIADDLIDAAHRLKHSMRADLGIIDYEYESDLNEVAKRLGKVDNF